MRKVPQAFGIGWARFHSGGNTALTFPHRHFRKYQNIVDWVHGLEAGSLEP